MNCQGPEASGRDLGWIPGLLAQGPLSDLTAIANSAKGWGWAGDRTKTQISGFFFWMWLSSQQL